jgi:hypothetical protein
MALSRLAAVLFAALAPSLHPQELPGPAAFHVTDPTGAPIPGASVNFDGGSEHPLYVFGTTGDGRALTSLPEGDYSVSVMAQGFSKWTKNLRIESRTGQTIQVQLHVATGGGVAVLMPDGSEILPGLDRVQTGASDPSATLVITVTDQTGAIIPQAAVQTEPFDRNSKAMGVDRFGMAAVHLTSGYHELKISARGFESLTIPATVGPRANRAMLVALPIDRFGGDSGPVVSPIAIWPDKEDLEPVADQLSVVALPFEPITSLPLSGRKIRSARHNAWTPTPPAAPL